MATRRKIPTGAGSHFVVTARTLRFPVERASGGLVAELWVNAGGDGAIALVPPGGVIPEGCIARQLSPIDAVELLRRGNMRRLAAGQPEHKIPPALIRRAKAETLPGIEALVPFPGRIKTFYEGRGSWTDTGLWVSADGEFQLEMRYGGGYLRKQLTQREAELWLRANGHDNAWLSFGHGKLRGKDIESEPWRIATRGDEHAGQDLEAWAFSWRPDLRESPTSSPPRRGGKAPKDRELRAAIGRARSIPQPTISPPKKPKARRPRRGR